MKEVKVFDFDGTLTTCDTLLAFIRFACGTRRFLLGFLRHSLLLVLMKLKLYSNGKAKQKIFSYFFSGTPQQRFDELCAQFAATHRTIIRTKAIPLISGALHAGEKVLIVTASVENWVRPFFNIFGEDATNTGGVMIVGTRIEVENGIVTGRFLTPNCYGEEKVRRLLEVLPDRHLYHLTAYGDSHGDRAMLAYADEAHYKPFRE